MAWAAKRSKTSKKYSAFYRDEHGIQRQKIGFPDKRATEIMAQKLEDEANRIRHGLTTAAERTRRMANEKNLHDHIDDYKAIVEAQAKKKSADGKNKHASATASCLKRLFADAGIRKLEDISKDAILTGLEVWRKNKLSARTLNHALGASKAFCGWLADAERIERLPKGLKKVKQFNEDADRRMVRRALTKEEVAKLLTAAENGKTLERLEPLPKKERKSKRGGYGWIGRKRHIQVTGPQRAALYRLAMSTGFRANEIRALTPESFHLDGDEPFIRLSAKDEKAGRGEDQPITREFAAWFRPFLEGKPPGKPAVHVPERAAKILRQDLKVAGIPCNAFKRGKASEGVVDFHALRHSYITILIEDGNNPKVVQSLARHSTVALTIGRYTTLRDNSKRNAIEGIK